MGTKRLMIGLCALILTPVTVGVAGPAAGAAPVPFGRMVPASRTFGTSSNWAGYVSTKVTFKSVSATWVQPKVKCTSSTSYAAFWVGLDGYADNTVEQTGVTATCRGGHSDYAGWFEFFPVAPKYFAATVRPGDVFHASVTESGGVFTTKLNDATRHWSGIARRTFPAASRSSAEIIAEAPGTGSTVLPLANFGTVKFTDAKANGSAIGSLGPVKITMVTSTSAVKAQPSAISNGKNFSITWHHS